MSAPIAIGLVGAGKHGERYLRHVVEDVSGLRIALVCRRDATAGREQAARVGARFVADFRELAVSPQIAAVVAAAPPALNRELATLAAGAGKAMLFEKPLAVDVASALAIRDAVQRAGAPFMVAHTLRMNGVVRAVRRHLEAIAPLRQLHLSQRFEPSRLAWLDDPAASGGGIVLHTGVHSFDLVRFLCGRDPASVFAATARVVTRRTEDNYVALFRFDGEPLTAVAAGSRSTTSRSGAIEVSGDGGQILADHVHGVAWRLEGSKRVEIDVGPPVATVRETLVAFERMLRAGGPPPISVDDGLWAVAMAEACYRSAASGAAAPLRVDGA